MVRVSVAMAVIWSAVACMARFCASRCACCAALSCRCALAALVRCCMSVTRMVAAAAMAVITAR